MHAQRRHGLPLVGVNNFFRKFDFFNISFGDRALCDHTVGDHRVFDGWTFGARRVGLRARMASISRQRPTLSGSERVG